MMKCKNCKAEFDDEALFCPECGVQVEMSLDKKTTDLNLESTPEEQTDIPALFCPNCGSKLEEGDEFCENCGHGLKETVSTFTEQKKKNLRLPLVIGGAVALLAVGLVAIPKAIGGGNRSGIVQEVFYVKDGGLHGASLKSAKKKPVEYTEQFVDSDSMGDGFMGSDFIGAVGLVSAPYGIPFVSKDGKYHFIVEDWSDTYTYTYTLYSQKGSGDSVKVDSNVQHPYHVTDDNQVVYRKNDNLYVSDLKEKTKIASDVQSFLVDKDGKNVLWYVRSDNDDNSYDIYYQDLSMKKDKKKLISNSNVVAVSSDLNILLAQKEESLYLINNQGEGEKLAANVEAVRGVDLNKGTFFYTDSTKKTVSAMDFVNDDMAAADAQITEPVKANYKKTEVVGLGVRARERTTVDDSYYEDLDLYNQKVDRDDLRRELTGMEVETPYEDLYYYSDGEAQLVTQMAADIDMWANRYSITDSEKELNKDFTSYLIYKRANDSLKNKVKLSEISDADAFEGMFRAVSKTDVEACLFTGGKETELDLDIAEYLEYTTVDVKNNQLYCIQATSDENDGTGELISISLGGDNVGKVENRDSDVNRIELVSDGNIYYMKDVNDRGVGDLYCNGQRVVTDVGGYTTRAVTDSSAIVCITDPSRESGEGSLMYLKGEKMEKIADDVSYYHAFGEDRVVVMTDYNPKRDKGELKYYNGKDLRTLDSDVLGFFY